MRWSPAAERWIEDELGPGARVIRVRPLRGGITSFVHDVTLARGDSMIHVVIRRYAGGMEESGRLVTQEAEILEGLANSAIPTPRLLATDPTGERAGAPALLMTKLPGRVFLTPVDMRAWLRQLAVQLCAIHELAPIGERFDEKWIHVANRHPPAWSARRSLWSRAIDVVAAGMPEPTLRRTHGDYQHFNVLWSRGRISGVLDWLSSWNGPFEIDVGHCRLNLAVLFSPDVAEQFRELYEAESGRICDPRWDLSTMLSYVGDDRWPRFIPVQVAGRAPLDVDGMDARVEGLVEQILARI